MVEGVASGVLMAKGLRCVGGEGVVSEMTVLCRRLRRCVGGYGVVSGCLTFHFIIVFLLVSCCWSLYWHYSTNYHMIPSLSISISILGMTIIERRCSTIREGL